MITFNQQGEIDITGTIIYTGTAGNYINNSNVFPIRFYNDLAYVIDLYIYDTKTGLETKLYSVSLTAGQIYYDTYNYIFKNGDYLKAYSDIAGSTFILTISDKTLV
jgi:hypothetical protein